MSKKLREIIDAKHLDSNRFYIDHSQQIIERGDSGVETPTGFYQNEAGTYFTRKAWKKEMKLIEKKNLIDEKAAKKADVRTIKLAEITNGSSHSRKKNKKKVIYLIGAVLLLLGIVIVSFFLYSENETPMVVERTEEVEAITPPEIFGNAIIAGEDVRLRLGPSLKDSILTYFPVAGERVLVLQAKTDSLPWAKVQRKDAVVGWVFGKYVEDIEE